MGRGAQAAGTVHSSALPSRRRPEGGFDVDVLDSTPNTRYNNVIRIRCYGCSSSADCGVQVSGTGNAPDTGALLAPAETNPDRVPMTSGNDLKGDT